MANLKSKLLTRFCKQRGAKLQSVKMWDCSVEKLRLMYPGFSAANALVLFMDEHKK